VIYKYVDIRYSFKGLALFTELDIFNKSPVLNCFHSFSNSDFSRKASTFQSSEAYGVFKFLLNRFRVILPLKQHEGY
jgi:hypothetical protein